jgi:hypothetical protein
MDCNIVATRVAKVTGAQACGPLPKVAVKLPNT